MQWPIRGGGGSQTASSGSAAAASTERQGCSSAVPIIPALLPMAPPGFISHGNSFSAPLSPGDSHCERHTGSPLLPPPPSLHFRRPPLRPSRRPLPYLLLLPPPPALYTSLWIPPAVLGTSPLLSWYHQPLRRRRRAGHNAAAAQCLTKPHPPPEERGVLACYCHAVSDSGAPPADADAADVSPASLAAKVPWYSHVVPGPSALVVGGGPPRLLPTSILLSPLVHMGTVGPPWGQSPSPPSCVGVSLPPPPPPSSPSIFPPLVFLGPLGPPWGSRTITPSCWNVIQPPFPSLFVPVPFPVLLLGEFTPPPAVPLLVSSNCPPKLFPQLFFMSTDPLPRWTCPPAVLLKFWSGEPLPGE